MNFQCRAGAESFGGFAYNQLKRQLIQRAFTCMSSLSDFNRLSATSTPWSAGVAAAVTPMGIQTTLEDCLKQSHVY